jgi:hypothetical protein
MEAVRSIYDDLEERRLDREGDYWDADPAISGSR